MEYEEIKKKVECHIKTITDAGQNAECYYIYADLKTLDVHLGDDIETVCAYKKDREYESRRGDIFIIFHILGFANFQEGILANDCDTLEYAMFMYDKAREINQSRFS